MKLIWNYSMIAVGVGLAFSASAIDRENVRVHALDLPQTAIAVADSDQREALEQSLIQPVLGQLPGGDRLTEMNGDVADGYYLFEVPLGADRFVQGSLTIDHVESAAVFLNGQRVSANGDSYSLKLQTGDHQLVVLASGFDAWDDVSLNWEGDADHDVVSTESPSALRLSAEQLYDAKTTSGLDTSPDGQYLIWRQQAHRAENSFESETDLFITNTHTGNVIYRWTDASARGFAWHPESDKLAFIANNRVELLDMEDLSVSSLTHQLEGVSGVQWLNDNQLIVSWNKPGEQDSGPAKRYQALEDRWSYFRNNSQLYLLNTATRSLSQITKDDVTYSLNDVHPDGDRIVVSQRIVDYAEPPHYAVQIKELNLADGTERDLGRHRTFNGALYAADGSVYVVAGAEFADGIGVNLPEGMLANNYDGQLYRYTDDGYEALSRDFDPAISSAMSLANGELLLRVTDKAGTQLYRFIPGNTADDSRYARVDTGVDVVGAVSVTETQTPVVYYSGVSASRPDRVAQLVFGGAPEVIWDSEPHYYRNSAIPEVRDWNFRNERGDTIYGRVYYPHDFDENESYPALVYYYGGTTPVQRGFTGRYPFNLWASQGYVVYVLQPTGAIGYGQEFSARHVNAWGEYTTDDIIEGTKRFLDEHRFVDSDRVGHMGASYGGFMTMLLATKTDIFAASMSHAGISNLTSYWGEGWWGFAYSGEASKGSFPWNNPELYTEQSPVYRADKVTAPMLLLHGDADTNVPPGESHIMYTALKLLGKDVELVEYYGQDHHIIGRDTRLHWWATYMSWFDKYLKDEPEWWESIY